MTPAQFQALCRASVPDSPKKRRAEADLARRTLAALRAEIASVIAPLGFGAKIALLSYLLALSFSAHGAHPGTAEFDQRLAEYVKLFTTKVTAMSKAEIAKESLPPFERSPGPRRDRRNCGKLQDATKRLSRTISHSCFPQMGRASSLLAAFGAHL